jgi:hypothetical protein
MLYSPYNIICRKSIEPEEKREQVLKEMLKLLLQKEHDPDSVSVKEFQTLLCFDPLKSVGELIEYYRYRRDVFIYKYEDYVAGYLKPLNKYLGLKIQKVEDVPEKRVMRSKSYGDWKDWFTPSDVTHYRKVLSEYMQIFGYNDNWELNKVQKIDPGISSEYVKKLMQEAVEFLIKEKNRKELMQK